jgi:hypothetical protein
MDGGDDLKDCDCETILLVSLVQHQQLALVKKLLTIEIAVTNGLISD